MEFIRHPGLSGVRRGGLELVTEQKPDAELTPFPFPYRRISSIDCTTAMTAGWSGSNTDGGRCTVTDDDRDG
jgi:hypothetical protein